MKHRTVSLRPAAMALLLSCAFPAAHAGERADASYAAALLELGRTDQDAREAWRARHTPAELQRDPALARQAAQELAQVQRRNEQALRMLVERRGFPDRDTVGAEAAGAAFLVAQHSTDRAYRAWFSKGCRPRWTRDATTGPTGRCSWTATASWQDSRSVSAPSAGLFPVEAPEALAGRRAEVGLPPLER
ncbi:hypothetical protein [[Pseudomonas] boreopolis]|uniref:hypothetical protein n=1 Tax=Xanthomonas boreopolis TaxID=86183 RepID=UPI003DA0E314